MQCIKILKDEDFSLNSIPFNNPRIRLGARGIIINQANEIAIFNKKIKNEFKLIGGGIKTDETPEEAFQREALEECGCQVEIIDCLGTIEEHKSLDNFKQISYIFVAKVVKNTEVTNLTQKEKEEESRVLWLTLEHAINLVKCSENNLQASKYENIYHSRFIVRRDYEILNYYQKSLNN